MMMSVKDPSRLMTLLWRVSAGVAVILLIITVILVVKVQSGPSAIFSGVITNQNTTVYLRNRPAEDGTIIAILDPGTKVDVDRSTTRDEDTWYHIRTDSGRGWISESSINLSRP
jgi:SH3-like domain-containing protein